MGGLNGVNGRHKHGQTQIQESLRPPEGGWGWMVAFGMALMFISTSGHYLSFVPLFSGILEQLGEQTTGATIIMTALTASVNFTGLVTNRLLRTMSYRVVAMLGAFLFALGMLLTVFAQSMVHIVVTYSIIAGIGMGLVAPSSYLAINSYFVSRRGLAMGFCQAGIGLGFIVVPYLVEAMLHSYGFRGTMLLLAGISFNSFVGALLYQPVEWHTVLLRLHKTIVKEDESDMEDVPLGSRPISMIGATTLFMDVIPDEEDDLTMVCSHGNSLANKTAEDTVSDRFMQPKNEHTWTLLRQVPDEAEEGDYATFSKPSTSSDPPPSVIGPRKSSCCLRLANSLSQSLDLALLKDPIYVNIVLGLSVSFASDTIFFTVFPFHLAQKPWPAFSDKEVALCLSITAGADAVARLILPIVTDRLGVGPRVAYLLGCFLSAVVRSIFASVHGFLTIATMSGVVGFLKGALVVNQSLIIAEQCPLDRFAAAYSLFMVINGVITLCLGPAVGVIRDKTNSFPFSIHVLSAILFLCVLMWVLEYIWVSCRAHTLRSLSHTLKTRLC
ncbi:hypothetical protein B7P43_G03446 [Cryptotermes secundus]|uniref:Major facilitator superfamily (MFS) profile domain-containing protein n=1 Tax=Cryptotermes secundus TaxID=105785 RepID=A0A2J7RLS5_9NEOP|nr:monocarboxylate transporter 9 isoform X2 [Cryptotermes secundus]PNF41759.1 hypothetical protein B7P43_G03446 [Cryptotermes secundus]